MDWFIAYKGKPHKGTLEGNLEKANLRYFQPVQTVERLEGDRMVLQEEKVLSNLIFLQTDQDIYQVTYNIDGLRYPYINLFTRKPAVVSNQEMERFMKVMQLQSVHAQFLENPIQNYSQHTRVRVKAGEFEGMEGYVVRFHRDRKLVIALDNMAVAISGIHYSLLEPINIEEKG